MTFLKSLPAKASKKIAYNISKSMCYMFENKIKILFVVGINLSFVHKTKYISNSSIYIFKESKSTKISYF